MQIPLHSYELIDLLDELYPEVMYDPEMNSEERLLRMGERRLVLKLKQLRASEIAERNLSPRSR